MRGHRRDLGLTQRSYAIFRGWSKGRQYRLESLAGELRLDSLVEALRGTGFRLALVHEESDGSSPNRQVGVDDDAGPAPEEVELVQPHEWVDTEFLARDAAGRRFPAHKRPYQPTRPPNWWLWRYSTSRCDSPKWSAAGWDVCVIRGWQSQLIEGSLDDPGPRGA